MSLMRYQNVSRVIEAVATREGTKFVSSRQSELRLHRLARPMRWRQWHPLTVFAVLSLWPTSAMANVGLPMLLVVWPSAWLLFVPVCIVEAFRG
jgi:hypothetical protein